MLYWYFGEAENTPLPILLTPILFNKMYFVNKIGILLTNFILLTKYSTKYIWLTKYGNKIYFVNKIVILSTNILLLFC